MPPSSPFPHLNLLLKRQGNAKLEGGGSENPQVTRNKANRGGHYVFLKDKIGQLTEHIQRLQLERATNGLPVISGGISFLLQIPDNDEEMLEFIAEKLHLEIVAEYEEGFLIVTGNTTDLALIQKYAEEFLKVERGSAKMAAILNIDSDPLSEHRIRRLFADEKLLNQWPFKDREVYILDVSIEVFPQGFQIPKQLSERSSREKQTQREFEIQNVQNKHVQEWDEKRIAREIEIEKFIQHYQGEILDNWDDSNQVEFPDSFSMRIRMSGQGFKDFIKNYPNLFEVSIPDDVQLTPSSDDASPVTNSECQLNAPSPDAPAICIIDSGIEEGHRLLSSAIRVSDSHCFLPEDEPDANNIADFVPNGGHGTRIAGACLYPHGIPNSSYFAPFWLLNARVLDDAGNLPQNIFPPKLLENIVRQYKTCNSSIFQHSIASTTPCRTTRMSTWATAIDLLSYGENVLFIQATGNISRNDIAYHINHNFNYPEYLYENISRIANPAQSLQALTVGSISSDFYSTQYAHSLASPYHPSAFTRTGFGLWDSIKPEVVEFGGDFAVSTTSPYLLTTPIEVCPSLVRSTLDGGPAIANDTVGTSYAAPKIAHIAGLLSAIFPNNSLLYRALIVNSARWPDWAENLPIPQRPQMIRAIGYGIPNIFRATENDAHRITLITEEIHEIKASEGFIFGVPIPLELRRPGDEYQIRIDITLSYATKPRRTRRSRRGYLGVGLDWKAGKKNESFNNFQTRVLKDFNTSEEQNTPDNFKWILGSKKEKNGETTGVSRNNGTVQKDWTIAQSSELPDVFGIIVRGHKGWQRQNPEATAKFSLVVSFEIMGKEIPIYEIIRNAITSEIENRQEIQNQRVQLNR